MKHITFEEEQRRLQLRQRRLQRNELQRERERQIDIRVQVRIEPVQNRQQVRIERLQQRQEHQQQQEEKEQLKMFRMYENKKKEEEERVTKRGLPRHIVQIVLDHSHDKNCMICFDEVTMNTIFITKCGHMMCKGCERKMYEKKNISCPTCRVEF